MFETIIWATDGSEAAERALEFAKQLATYEGGQVIAVHANELMGGRGGGYPVFADEEEVERKLMHEVANLRDQGVRATFKLITSARHDAGRMIADFARGVDADAIVVGTRGHSAVTNLFLGSVTQRLLHIAHCPVLAIPPLKAAELAQEADERVAVS